MHNIKNKRDLCTPNIIFLNAAKKILLLFFCVLAMHFAHAELRGENFKISIYTEKEILNVNDINEVIHSDVFVPLKEYDKAMVGHSWLKIQWDKNKVHNERFLLNNQLSVNLSESYFLIKDNQIIENYSTGIDQPFSTRPIEHFKFAFDVKQADYVLAKICCSAKFSKYFHLLSENELAYNYHYKLIRYAVIYALIAAFIIYNFVIWVYLRDVKYFWYCCYLSATLLGLLSFSGIGKEFLWPNAINIHFLYYNQGIIFTYLGMKFITSFLDKKFISKRTFQSLYVIVSLQIIATLVFFVALFGFKDDFPTFLSQYVLVIQALTRLGLLVNIYVIVRSLIAGDKTARLLIFGYGLVNVGVMIVILRNFYTIPDNSWTEFGMEIAIVIEAILLSLALAQNIQELKDQKLTTEKKKRQLQEAFSWQLIEVQETEKRQIGKTLQDNFSHQLLVLKDSVMRKIGAGFETENAEEIIDEMRDLSSLYHPHILENLGLEEGLLALIEQIERKNEIDVNFAYSYCSFVHQHNLVIFRIVQEALNNVVKHASASECVIAIDCRQDLATLLIKDDGKGFNVDNEDGFGLKMIKVRCKKLSGKIAIQSSGSGTSIQITFPISHSGKTTHFAQKEYAL